MGLGAEIQAAADLNVAISIYSTDEWITALQQNQTPDGETVSAVHFYDFDSLLVVEKLDDASSSTRIVSAGGAPKVQPAVLQEGHLVTPVDDSLLCITKGNTHEVYLVSTNLFQQYLGGAKKAEPKEQIAHGEKNPRAKEHQSAPKKSPAPAQVLTIYSYQTIAEIAQTLQCNDGMAAKLIAAAEGDKEVVFWGVRYFRLLQQRTQQTVIPFRITQTELRKRGYTLPQPNDATKIRLILATAKKANELKLALT